MNRPEFWLPILFPLLFAGAPPQLTASIYDEQADAHRDVAAAIAKAGATQRKPRQPAKVQ